MKLINAESLASIPPDPKGSRLGNPKIKIYYQLNIESQKILKEEMARNYPIKYKKNQDQVDQFIETFKIVQDSDTSEKFEVLGNFGCYDIKNAKDYSGIYGFVNDLIVGCFSKSYYTMDFLNEMNSNNFTSYCNNNSRPPHV